MRRIKPDRALGDRDAMDAAYRTIAQPGRDGWEPVGVGGERALQDLYCK